MKLLWAVSSRDYDETKYDFLRDNLHSDIARVEFNLYEYDQ